MTMYALELRDVPTALEERFVEELDARGRVGIVRPGPGSPSIDLTDETTITTGSQAGSETLDLLAPRCDYAVSLDVPLAFGPVMEVSDESLQGPLLDEPTAVADVDVGRIADRLEDTEPYVTLESLVEEIKQHPDADQAGAIATFTGRVRARDGPDDPPTEHLEFERYGEVAREEMDRIRSELTARDGVHEVLMHHRTGVLPAGRDIVFVVVLAGHRAEAFHTVEDGINRLKADVPIFKKEVTIDDEYWVHNRP